MAELDPCSDRFLASALLVTGVGTWCLDTTTGQMEWNSVASALLGLASPSSVNDLLSSVDPADRDEVTSFLQPSGHCRDRATAEFRIKRPGGDTCWLQLTGGFPEERRSRNGHLIGIVRDVSCRKAAELRSHESRQQLEALLNCLPGMAYRSETTAPWRLIFVSDGAAQVTGFDPAEFLRGERTWETLVHPDDLAMISQQARQAIAEHRFYTLFYRIVHQSGEVRWVHGRGEAVYDGQGQPVFLEGFVMDVTEQVLAEVRLRQSRSLLETVIEGMPDGVFLKDYGDGGRYVVVNSALMRLVSRSATDVVGLSDDQLFPPDQTAKYVEEDQLLANPDLPSLTLERTVETPLGSRLLEVRKVPIRNEEAKLCYILGIVRDLTDQRALEAQIHKMQRMDAVGQLTGGVAHDFNNLLTIILGYGEMLREDMNNPQALALMDKILNAADRGSELVRRLLAFARKQRLEPRIVNLNERLPDVVALLRRTLGENIAVEIAPGPGLWPALADPTQIDDALVNLAINARDAMPAGGKIIIETANVRLEPETEGGALEAPPGDYVMLAVSDTGHGMTPEIMARVFEPFFTTKELGQGTGLGLSMVYGFVRQSGGHVTVDSTPGHGTIVRLYLPRAAEGTNGQLDCRPAPPEKGGGETVLLVEDNDSIRAMARLQLGNLGYRVVEAANATGALGLLGKGVEADLLFTDILMPGGISGYELAEKARLDRPGLKVLFTTGYDSPAVNQNLKELPGENLLRKPYRQYELANAVRRALDQG